MTKKNPRTCFVVHPLDRKGDMLISALTRREIAWVDASTLVSSEPLSSAIQNQMRSVDFVCAYLPDSNLPPSLWFELGVARGLGKPLLIFSNIKDPAPYFLTGESFINAISQEAIEFQLDAFIHHLKNEPKHPSKKHPGPPSLSRQQELPPLEIGDVTNTPAFGWKLESLVAEAFRRTGMEYWVDPKPGADMALWLDELGGPLLVDVKVSSQGEGLLQAEALLLQRVLERGASAGMLIFWTNAPSKKNIEVSASLPLLLKIPVEDFLGLANDGKLIQTIVHLRNLAAHQVR